MSKLYENSNGFYISHGEYIDKLYANMEKPLRINPKLFGIKEKYKTQKRTNSNIIISDNHKVFQEEQEDIKLKFHQFMTNFLQNYNVNICAVDGKRNRDALETAEAVLNESGKALVKTAYGANRGAATVKTINGFNFVFPENSNFFCKDIVDIEKYLTNEKYDLILLDPPWWNKYIRRKRKKTGDAYNMLFNSSIKDLPIESLLKNDGMVVVWCTNCQQHLNYILNEIFPKWNVQYIGKWYWIKVTLSSEPVCSFSLPPGKQPYEQIIFGCRGNLCALPFTNKVVVSVPSAIHSHKPPLDDLLKTFLPNNPACLEIFARYLLPNWTSYGNEVLRLQHESLFVPF